MNNVELRASEQVDPGQARAAAEGVKPVDSDASRQPRRPRTLAYALVEDFERRILGGELRPGDKLPTEAEIIKTSGVSRTVVRDAVSRLQAAGLVETHQGIGTFVLEARPARALGLGAHRPFDLFAALEFRTALEVEAAGLAASRRTAVQLAEMRRLLDLFQANVEHVGDTVAPDLRFHLQIAEATGNPHFAETLIPLGASLIPRTRIDSADLSSADLPSYLSMVNREHEEIYRAIARGDSASARAAMTLHLGNSRERQLEAQARKSPPKP